MRFGIAKERHDLVRRHGGNRSTHSRDCSDDGVLEIPREPAQLLGFKLDSEAHCAHEVASKRSELSSLGCGWLGAGWSCVSTRPNYEFVSDAWNSYQEPGNLRIRLNLAP